MNSTEELAQEAAREDIAHLVCRDRRRGGRRRHPRSHVRRQAAAGSGRGRTARPACTGQRPSRRPARDVPGSAAGSPTRSDVPGSTAEGRSSSSISERGSCCGTIAPQLGDILGLACVGDDVLASYSPGRRRASSRVETLDATSVASVEDRRALLRGPRLPGRSRASSGLPRRTSSVASTLPRGGSSRASRCRQTSRCAISRATRRDASGASTAAARSCARSASRARVELRERQLLRRSQGTPIARRY